MNLAAINEEKVMNLKTSKGRYMDGLSRAREGNNDAVVLFYSRKNKTENEL